MELINAMEGRRSIRKFKEGAKVTEEQLKELVKAARLAPSWVNYQPVRYYAAISEEGIKAVKSALSEVNQPKVNNVSALVVMTFIKGLSGFRKDGSQANPTGEGWGYFDTGSAAYGFCLKAYEMGLGSLIIGGRDEARLRELLSIPAGEAIVSVIALGDEEFHPKSPGRKEPEELIKRIF